LRRVGKTRFVMRQRDTATDIPKQYLKTIKRTGLGSGLFAECAIATTAPKPRISCSTSPAYRNARILVAGDNFGCGSSREHAPWALLDFRHPLRDLHELRRHFLQQLLQERSSCRSRCR
jgi:3-isopropylmalate dehydratase small subunit